MSLTKSTISIYKQRIIHSSRILSNSKSSSLSKLIRFTNHKTLKSIILIQIRNMISNVITIVNNLLINNITFFHITFKNISNILFQNIHNLINRFC